MALTRCVHSTFLKKFLFNPQLLKLRIENIKSFKYLPQILLIPVAILGYWQVSMMLHPLNFDIIDCTYPWKYFVGECLQHHILPLWNPYQTLGYPIHADPQVGVWYPLTWIIGSLHGYDIYTIHFEFVLHIYFASLGMFILGRTLKFSKSVAFFMAVAYMFSGIFIGNSQHYMIITSAAWLPFVINYYIRFSEEFSYKKDLIAAFFMFLMISGGYPSYIIILAYFLFFFFVFFIYKKIREKNRTAIFRLVKLNLLFALVALLFSTVVIVSGLSVNGYITRGGRLPLATVLMNPFSPQSLLSIIVPYASVKNTPFFDTDVSMSNIYIGLLPLLFFVFALFKKMPKMFYFFIIFGVFALFASMGKYTPVRTFLYDYIPFMGIFRFPGLFRLFTIIGLIIPAGYALQQFQTRTTINTKPLKIIIISFMILLTGTIICLRFNGYLSMIDFIKNALFANSASSTIIQHLAFQCGIQIIFLGIILLILIKVKERKNAVNFFLLILFADMIFSAQLNEPYTTFSKNYDVASIKKHSESFPDGFPIPSTNNVIGNTDIGLGFGPIWRNLNCFNKQIAWDGFTSFELNSYENMSDSMPGIFKSALANPPVFLTDKIFPLDSMKKHSDMNRFDNKNIYLTAKDLSMIKKNEITNSKENTAVITSFSPVDIKVQVSSRLAQMLVLQQNYYPGWKVTINDHQETIVQNNKERMSVLVPKGKNIVEFTYSNNKVVYAALISLLSLIAFIVLLFMRKTSGGSKEVV